MLDGLWEVQTSSNAFAANFRTADQEFLTFSMLSVQDQLNPSASS